MTHDLQALLDEHFAAAADRFWDVLLYSPQAGASRSDERYILVHPSLYDAIYPKASPQYARSFDIDMPASFRPEAMIVAREAITA